MFGLFIGYDILISGWITAHLLAVISVYFLRQTQLIDTIVQWLEVKAPNHFIHSNARWLVYLSMVASLGAVLTILMVLEPSQGGILALISSFLFDIFNLNEYSFVVDDILIVLGVILLLAFIPIINSLFAKLYQVIDNLRNTHLQEIRIQNLEVFTPNQVSKVLIRIAKYIRTIFILLIAGLSVMMVFNLYPGTESLAQSLRTTVYNVFITLWDNFLAFLPNLLSVIFIIFLARLAMRLLRFLHDGLQQGKIKFSSIHPELVEPTFQLLRVLVVALALVAVFPFIPGSSSPVFRGLSIFVGFLISLGSTSLITNLISGIVLTFSRGLKVGDRVRIGDAVGDVVDRTMLVTRIRTIKNVVITIPNGMVMKSEIVNYSAEAREGGLILHTSVTIGYDVSWRQVEKLLIDAAKGTAYILEHPKPFVFKTSLDDSYISYELNAYTIKPNFMADIYSELHQNILDKFHQADVEILSPSYLAVRDGKESTVLQEQVSKNGKNGSSTDYFSPNSYSGYREKTQPQGSR
jgi:small-conductance mechanosensitive channel